MALLVRAYEIDDLIHNSIGCGLGAMIINRLAQGKIEIDNRKRFFLLVFAIVVILITLGIVYQLFRRNEMKRFAELNDREDGNKNLLILSPDPVYIGESAFKVKYYSNGNVLIKGSTKSMAWIEIGRVTLEPGTYVFYGLSDVEEKTIVIMLENYNLEDHEFFRLTDDVGYNDCVFLS